MYLSVHTRWTSWNVYFSSYKMQMELIYILSIFISSYWFEHIFVLLDIGNTIGLDRTFYCYYAMATISLRVLVYTIRTHHLFTVRYRHERFFSHFNRKQFHWYHLNQFYNFRQIYNFQFWNGYNLHTHQSRPI